MARTIQWLQAGSYPASDDRRLIGALWPTPASTGCAVTAGGTNMTVNVAVGQVAVPTQNNTGSTLCSSTAVETVTVATAPGVGLNRIDLVVAQPRGTDLDGGANNDFIFTTVAGVAAASPVAPATPAGAVTLAQVYVGANVAVITNANVTDLRPFGLAVGGALALPPALGAGAPFASFTDPSGEVWVAKGGVYGGAWKKARDVMFARAFRAAALSFAAATWTSISMDTASTDPYGLLQGGSLVVPITGIWHVGGAIYIPGTTRVIVGIYANGSLLSQGYSTIVSGTVQTGGGAEDTAKLAAGTALNLAGYIGTATAAQTGTTTVYFSATYHGTG